VALHQARNAAEPLSVIPPVAVTARTLTQAEVILTRQAVAEVRALAEAFPCSGEINFRVADAPAKIGEILAAYAAQNPALDETDGVSLEFPDWRFNLRSSNTEPLLRLNVETRGDAELLVRRTRELQTLIGG